jgi:hypothetical protein
MLGIQVYQERAESHQHSISVEHLPQGYYSLIIDTEVLPILILR